MCKNRGQRWKCGHTLSWVYEICSNATDKDVSSGTGCNNSKIIWYSAPGCCSTNCCQRAIDEKIEEFRRLKSIPSATRSEIDRLRYIHLKRGIPRDVKFHITWCLESRMEGRGFTNERRLVARQPLLEPYRLRLLRAPEYVENDPAYAAELDQHARCTCANYDRALYEYQQVQGLRKENHATKAREIVKAGGSGREADRLRKKRQEREEELQEQLRAHGSEAEKYRKQMRKLEQDILSELPNRYQYYLGLEHETHSWQVNGPAVSPMVSLSRPSTRPPSRTGSESSRSGGPLGTLLESELRGDERATPELHEDLVREIDNFIADWERTQNEIPRLLVALQQLRAVLGRIQPLGLFFEYHTVDFVVSRQRLRGLHDSIIRLSDRIEQLNRSARLEPEQYEALAEVRFQDQELLEGHMRYLVGWANDQDRETLARIENLERDDAILRRAQEDQQNFEAQQLAEFVRLRTANESGLALRSSRPPSRTREASTSHPGSLRSESADSYDSQGNPRRGRLPPAPARAPSGSAAGKAPAKKGKGPDRG